VAVVDVSPSASTGFGIARQLRAQRTHPPWCSPRVRNLPSSAGGSTATALSPKPACAQRRSGTPSPGRPDQAALIEMTGGQ
jgi:hypothetical protein